ncbi:ATP-binding protein [Aerosakkonema funiforme]|uniref:histidine kinase n=2 Tax=Oscillatoriophycideae TaxID=1301283 RepID=A0A926ZGJ4_9CYAN|nr:ATP-binding protein [Aerosakkonema funiforme]MBD2182303.1 response regulator [Aerosakkonema funiforme FACHB-1375]
MTTLLTIEIRSEQDVVMSRQLAREIAQALGFDSQDQTRIATAVSEIARNCFQYAKGGKVEFWVEGHAPPIAASFQYSSEAQLNIAAPKVSSEALKGLPKREQVLLISVEDKGTGIPNIKQILDGNYKSQTGMGLGIVGSKRLMDRFEIESSPDDGTKVVMGKNLPKRAAILTAKRLAEITQQLATKYPENSFSVSGETKFLSRPTSQLFEEIKRQNQELIRTLEELRKRQEELNQINRELEETNRGVVALYAELDEKAEFLQRANELKTHFLSNMSHEFRTPLNSILSLSRMLLDRLDGELSAEQEKQVIFIRKSAESLLDLVNDLLDLAKVEAGKIVVHTSEFEVRDLFATLRGMLRPLLSYNSSISLIIEEPKDIPTLHTDEAKVAQILRNFISNALKYTEKGEVIVKAVRNGNNVVFSVTDTGIGIALKDRERIFEEFIQVDSYIQKHVKGTGLGLSLSRRLAELLGGSVSVESELGVGSTFFATIPLVYGNGTERESAANTNWQLNSMCSPILAIEDNEETLFTYQKYFEKSIYQLIATQSLKEARYALKFFKPKAVILDIVLKEEKENAWDFISEIKSKSAIQDIPICAITAVDNERKCLALGADAFLKKPVERLLLLNKINALIEADKQQKLLVVDDNEIARYLLKEILHEAVRDGKVANCEFLVDSYPSSQSVGCLSLTEPASLPFPIVIEADSGSSGIHLAQVEHPACIFLDLVMPDMNGFEVLEQLKSNPDTKNIPVIINTSKHLVEEEISYLDSRVIAILSKENLSHEQTIASFREALTLAGIVVKNY